MSTLTPPRYVLTPLSVHLPAEIVYNILGYLNIGDMATFIKVFAPQMVGAGGSEAIDNVADVKKYLGKLTPFVDELLYVMRVTGTILSGSRASSYFTPCCSTELSDWDFISTYGENYTGFKTATTALGFEWTDIQENRDYEDRVSYGSAPNSGNLAAHNLNLIQCMVDPVAYVVLSFDMSIVKCFVSWCSAVSIYHSTTRLSQSTATGESACGYSSASRNIKDGASEERQEKYRARGISIVSGTGPRARSVLDNECMVIDVEKIVPDSYLSYRASSHSDTLRKMSWDEDAQGRIRRSDMYIRVVGAGPKDVVLSIFNFVPELAIVAGARFYETLETTVKVLERKDCIFDALAEELIRDLVIEDTPHVVRGDIPWYSIEYSVKELYVVYLQSLVPATVFRARSKALPPDLFTPAHKASVKIHVMALDTRASKRKIHNELMRQNEVYSSLY